MKVVLPSWRAALRSCRRSPEFVVPRQNVRGPATRQGIKRGVGAGWSAATDTAPRALTRQRPELRSREVDGEPGERWVSAAAAHARGRTPRAASALSERCDVRSAARLEGMARAGASPRDAAPPQERSRSVTGPRYRSLRDGRRSGPACKMQRHGWMRVGCHKEQTRLRRAREALAQNPACIARTNASSTGSGLSITASG